MGCPGAARGAASPCARGGPGAAPAEGPTGATGGRRYGWVPGDGAAECPGPSPTTARRGTPVSHRASCHRPPDGRRRGGTGHHCRGSDFSFFFIADVHCLTNHLSD
ncbi:hypothetical protein SSCG_02407 [Streptomyces clavuligerus]|nr:hypothetical protein SSCG_02407 [Streptomyces clavuligerus]